MSALPALQESLIDDVFLKRRPKGALWEKIARAAEMPTYGHSDEHILERLGWSSPSTLEFARRIYRHHTWGLWADMKTAARLIQKGYSKTDVLGRVRWNSPRALERALYIHQHANEDLKLGILGGLSLACARVVVDEAIYNRRFPRDWMPYLIENALCYQLSAPKLRRYIQRIILAEADPKVSRHSLELEKLGSGVLLGGLL